MILLIISIKMTYETYVTLLGKSNMRNSFRIYFGYK